MTCADNCSSCSHDRAAVVATALAGLSGRLGLLWQRVSPVYPSATPPPPSPIPLGTTNQIQMHIPNNRCTHSRAVDEIMVDCTLHTGAMRRGAAASVSLGVPRNRSYERSPWTSLRRSFQFSQQLQRQNRVDFVIFTDRSIGLHPSL